MVTTIDPNINYNTSAGITTAAQPTAWDRRLILDRMQVSAFEHLKVFTNSIMRYDLAQIPLGMYDPLKGIPITFSLSKELFGAGVTGTTQLLGREEKISGNTFTFQAQKVRHAVGWDDIVVNTNLIADEYNKERDMRLNRWATIRKEKNDIARLLAGTVGYNIIYGNGKCASASSITSADTLVPKGLSVLREVLIGSNSKPVSWLVEPTSNQVPHEFYVQLADDLVLGRMAQDPTWQNLMSQSNQNTRWDHPLMHKAYGAYDNMAIIPVSGVRGFGSPLRPECIVATTGSGITNTSSADVYVGLPKYASATTFTSYDPSTELTDYAEYFNAFITASGIVNLPVTIKRIGAADVINCTVVYKNGYTLTLTNNSGATYTPTAGDRIISNLACTVGLGGEAMVSAYVGNAQFVDDDRDYKQQRGRGIEFWEGASVIKDSIGGVPGVSLNFVYSPVGTQQ